MGGSSKWVALVDWSIIDMTLEIESAEKVKLYARACLWGVEKSGKTHTALMLATALAGEGGKVAVIGQRYGLVRHGGAVAVSLPEYIQGFRGYRYRWWDYDQERPFPQWQDQSARLVVPDETTLRARNIPETPPHGLEHAYDLTQAIARAEAAKQPQERPVFGDGLWITRAKKKSK